MKSSRVASDRLNETHHRVSISGFPHERKETSNEKGAYKLPWPIEMVSPHKLRPANRNARTHSKKQIKQIADSVLRFGFVNPIVADNRSRIVAGHARAEAAKLLGLNRIPVIRLSNLSETEVRAYMLADNKLAEKAGWNREMLALDFQDLQIALPEIGLDISATGFEPGEIDSILSDFGDDKRPYHEPEISLPSDRIDFSLEILATHKLMRG